MPGKATTRFLLTQAILSADGFPDVCGAVSLVTVSDKAVPPTPHEAAGTYVTGLSQVNLINV
jgi:hypothetical protein